jgi:hypothetical protein
MRSISPVLLVGTGDFSELRAALRAHSFGTMVAPSFDEARLMLRNFRVDAIIAFVTHADDLKRVSTFRAPLVVVGDHGLPLDEVNCAAYIAPRSAASMMPRVLERVISGERGIYETRGAA